METGGEPSWLRTIATQLEAQSQILQEPFGALIEAYTESIQREEAAEDARLAVEEQLCRQQEMLHQATEELESIRSSGGIDNRKYQELEGKYRQIKQECIELYRTQSQNAQKLLELNESLKHQGQTKEHLELEIKKLRDRLSKSQIRIGDLDHLIEEKNLHIQILQDELQALQLELIQTDERVKTLEQENQQLVQRWLSKVNETVEKLNSEVENTTSSILPAPVPNARGISATNIGNIQRRTSGIVVGAGGSMILIAEPDKDHGFPIHGPWGERFLASADGELLAGCFCRGDEIFAGCHTAEAETIQLWSVKTGRLLGSLEATGPIEDFAGIGSGALLSLQSNGSLKLFDLSRLFCLWTETIGVRSRQICKLHDDVVAVLLEDGEVCLWDVGGRRLICKSPPQLPVLYELAFDFGSGKLAGCSEKGLVCIDTNSLRPMQLLNIASPTWDPYTRFGRPSLGLKDGRFAACNGNQLILGNLDPLAISRTHQHDQPLAGIGWIDGEHLAIADRCGLVQLINLS